METRELEEGEIDLDLEPPWNANDNYNVDSEVNSIREALESVSVIAAEKSFHGVCYGLQNTLETLQKVLENIIPTKDTLIGLSFSKIQLVNDVYRSLSSNLKDQHTEIFSRLISVVLNQDPPIFDSERMKEVEAMLLLLNSSAALSNDKDKEKLLFEKVNQNITNESSEASNSEISRLRHILVDPYKDHDLDNLPSPTRENNQSVFHVHESLVLREPKSDYYITEAVKAVSTYQQKFGRASFIESDRFPSPTPSENSADKGDDLDINGEAEVSSSVETIMNVTSTSSLDADDRLNIQGTASDSSNVGSRPIKEYAPPPNFKVSAKTRDPRIRFANSLHVVSSDVSKLDTFEQTSRSTRDKLVKEDSIMDGPAYKRQKNDLFNSADISRDLKNVSRQLLTINPATLNALLGALPIANGSSPKPSDPVLLSPGVPQVVSQKSPTENVPKIRMKARDPRRFLHHSGVASTTSSSSSTTQCKSNGAPDTLKLSSLQRNKETLINNEKLDKQQAEIKSSVAPPPDITRQFTKNLKNIADLISFPQATVVSQEQSTQGKIDRKDVNSESNEGKIVKMPGGEVNSHNTWGDVEHLFEGYDDKQKAAIQKERARRVVEQKKMFAARKLCLVLDLDHTLLNSAKFTEVDPVHDEILRKKEEQDREKSERHLFRFPYMGMWTKLRPGVWSFLEKASRLFEMHLYTMGNKLYATEMAKILDPKGELFGDRVISRGDDGDVTDGDDNKLPKSKDLEGVLGMESAVVIIDDSVRVWPHNKLNLILVERYTYFPCSRRQFGLPGPSLLEIDHDERAEDGTLASCSAVIEKIHSRFFSHRSLEEVDVRNILASEQRKILAGCKIVFSRVFPVDMAEPHLHPLWQTAQQFGAVCSIHIDEKVTHVVANSLGTDKVNWALSTGRFVVHPGWVEASALLYRRGKEQDFAIKQ